MQLMKEACPLDLAATGQAAQTAGVVSTRQAQFITSAAPVALEVYKRGRWCIVAKVTFLDGERILAIAHRNQAGVKDTISVPLMALDFAHRAGCRSVNFRRDMTGEMWRIALADLWKVGWLNTSDGIPELFLKIERMQAVPWQKWEFAERSVRLGEQTHERERQLSLFASVT